MHTAIDYIVSHGAQCSRIFAKVRIIQSVFPKGIYIATCGMCRVHKFKASGTGHIATKRARSNIRFVFAVTAQAIIRGHTPFDRHVGSECVRRAANGIAGLI